MAWGHANYYKWSWVVYVLRCVSVDSMALKQSFACNQMHNMFGMMCLTSVFCLSVCLSVFQIIKFSIFHQYLEYSF